MSWECRYLYNGYCRKRDKDCVPGEPGCVLYGKYEFPFQEDSETKTGKKKQPSNSKKPDNQK